MSACLGFFCYGSTGTTTPPAPPKPPPPPRRQLLVLVPVPVRVLVLLLLLLLLLLFLLLLLLLLLPPPRLLLLLLLLLRGKNHPKHDTNAGLKVLAGTVNLNAGEILYRPVFGHKFVSKNEAMQDFVTSFLSGRAQPQNCSTSNSLLR